MMISRPGMGVDVLIFFRENLWAKKKKKLWTKSNKLCFNFSSHIISFKYDHFCSIFCNIYFYTLSLFFPVILLFIVFDISFKRCFNGFLNYVRKTCCLSLTTETICGIILPWTWTEKTKNKTTTATTRHIPSAHVSILSFFDISFFKISRYMFHSCEFTIKLTRLPFLDWFDDTVISISSNLQ